MKRAEPRQAEIFPTSLGFSSSRLCGDKAIGISVGEQLVVSSSLRSSSAFSASFVRCCVVVKLLSQQTIAGAAATIKTFGDGLAKLLVARALQAATFGSQPTDA